MSLICSQRWKLKSMWEINWKYSLFFLS